jgi:hypothetical protein
MKFVRRCKSFAPKLLYQSKWKIKNKIMNDIYWRTDKPPKVGQYIVNIGANGISWGWWNGNNWIKLWHDYKIDVYGWLPTPLHKQQDNEN